MDDVIDSVIGTTAVASTSEEFTSPELKPRRKDIVTDSPGKASVSSKTDGCGSVGNTSTAEDGKKAFYKLYNPFRPFNFLVKQAIHVSGSEGMSFRELLETFECVATEGNIERTMKSLESTGKVASYRKAVGRQNVKKFTLVGTINICTDLFKQFAEDTGVDLSNDYDAKLFSDRSIKRMLTIVNFLREKKAVYNRDIEDGFDYIIDHKHLARLLTCLERHGLVRRYKTVIKIDGSDKDITLFCEGSIEITDPIVKQVLSELRINPGRLNQFTSAETLLRAKDSTVSWRPKYALKRKNIEAGLPANEIVEAAVEEPSPKKKKKKKKKRKSGAAAAPPSDSSRLSQSIEKLFKDQRPGQRPGSSDPTKPKETSSYPDCAMARSYGFQPKMVRLQLLHELLFYVLYSHEGRGPSFEEKYLPKVALLLQANKTGGGADNALASAEVVVRLVTDSDNEAARGSKDLSGPNSGWLPEAVPESHVYVNEASWKRYIPPAHKVVVDNTELSQGWFVLSDLLMLVPLSIYCQLVPMYTKIPYLDKWLADPIRRHTLVPDLPAGLRSALLSVRRHITYFDEACTALSGMRLLSSGFQKTVLLQPSPSRGTCIYFLHRHASVVDTSSSADGFLFISEPVSNYKQYDYEFDCTEAVQMFWHHLHAVSVSTPLGHRLREKPAEREILVSNHDVRSLGRDAYGISVMPYDVIEDIERRRANFFSESQQFKCGNTPVLPGAGGFHPLFYLYKSNRWILNRSACAQWTLNDRQANRIKFFENILKRCEHVVYSWKNEVQNRVSLKKGGFGRGFVAQKLKAYGCSRERDVREVGPPRSTDLLEPTKRKRKRYARVVLDETDQKCVAQRMRERNIFTKNEKHLLTLLKAVNNILSPNNKLCVSPIVIRDLMHQYCPESQSKTATQLNTAANREMLRDKLSSMLDVTETIRNNKKIMNFVKSVPLITFSMPEQERRKIFTDVFEVARNTLGQAKTDFDDMPDTLEEFNSMYTSEVQKKSFVITSFNKDVESLSNAREAILRSCIYGNYGLSRRDGNFMLQLEHLYNQFSDAELQTCIDTLMSSGVLVVRKGRHCKNNPKIAQKFSAGHLTFSYFFRHFFFQRYFLQLNTDGFNVYREALRQPVDIIGHGTPSSVALFSCLLAVQKVELNTELPENLIMSITEIPELELQQPCSSTQADAGESSEESDREENTTAPVATSEDTTKKDDRRSQRTRVMKMLQLFRGAEANADDVSDTVINVKNVRVQRCRVFAHLQDAVETGGTGGESEAAESKKRKMKKEPSLKFADDPTSLITMRAEFRRLFATLTSFPLAPSVCRWLESVIGYLRTTYGYSSLHCAGDSFQLTPEHLSGARLIWDEYQKTIAVTAGSDSANILCDLIDVLDCEKLGLTKKDIVALLSKKYSTNAIFDALQQLRSDGMILRVGVTCWRYVSFRWCYAWVVQSIRIDRDNKAILAANQKSEISPEPAKTVRRNRRRSPSPAEVAAVAEHTSEVASLVTAISKESFGELLLMLPRPWLKPDGSLNRGILKWLLEGLYLHLMSNPGQTIEVICEKFDPALQPTITMEMLEFLESMGCLRSFEMDVVEPCRLFSASRPSVETKTCYEPTLEGTLRFHVAFEHTPVPDFVTIDNDEARPMSTADVLEREAGPHAKTFYEQTTE